ncbi:MAG TPA: hypothetical protein VH277_16515 [Gemmatimonadaceae bacterium]|nr:hypothetical protein [Gemmatimonadaceae bacterium]
MKEDRFEALMRDAAHTFRKPPEPDLDEMWSGIERAMDAEAVQRRAAGSRWPRWTGTIGIIAATLVVGIGLGRISMTGRQAATPNRVATVQPVQPAPVASTAIASGFDVETSRYLGQTAALLIALPSEMHDGRTDEQFVGRASELLTRTRLLLDSPAANDPQMRNLLEDLELVLAQIVRLQDAHASRTELDLINRALQQRDVIPRLRNAAADISAN